MKADEIFNVFAVSAATVTVMCSDVVELFDNPFAIIVAGLLAACSLITAVAYAVVTFNFLSTLDPDEPSSDESKQAIANLLANRGRFEGERRMAQRRSES